jgi:hypothetical protein
VFGGTDPIDPRVLSGLGEVYAPTEGDAQRPRGDQQQSEDLNGLY